MNNALPIDKIIAQRIGELEIQCAKYVVLIERLRADLAARDAELARIRASQPELPMNSPATPPNSEANGRAH